VVVVVVVVVVARSATICKIEGRLLDLLLVDRASEGERSFRLSGTRLFISLLKTHPLKIEWKSYCESRVGGIILALLRTLGKGVVGEMNVS